MGFFLKTGASVKGSILKKKKRSTWTSIVNQEKLITNKCTPLHSNFTIKYKHLPSLKLSTGQHIMEYL